MQTLQNNTSPEPPSTSASRKRSTLSLGQASPDTSHSYLRNPLPEMPSLASAHEAGLPSTDKSESPRNFMVPRDKDRSIQQSETASGKTRQSSRDRSDLDSRDRKWDHVHKQAIFGSITDIEEQICAKTCGSWNDEAQGAADKEIDQSPFEMIDFDPEAIATRYKRVRQRETQRRFDTGEIKCVEKINCCRCKAWSAFPGGKCADICCQHKCCETCRQNR